MPRPNLLFLMSDQQQAATVDPASPCQTPNLDRLAGRGVRFERCFTPNPICSPTRASMMTGTLPHTHGMVDCTHTVEPYRSKFNADLPFWTRNLRAAGYRIGYFGKWHIERSERLEDFGIATYETNLAGYRDHCAGLGVETGHGELDPVCAVQQKGYRDFLLYGVTDRPEEATRPYYLYSRGIDFIRQAAKTPDRPWAVFVSTTEPHDPYIAPRGCYERYDPSALPRPASFDDDLADRPSIYRICQGVWRDLEWPQFAEATACYYGSCSHLDDQVGRILAALRETGQADNTIVVYTSDHGDYMGAHRLMLKGIPAFDEAYKAPLILAGPGVPKGRTLPQVISHMDLAPTLVALTTGDDFACEARSLVPLLSGNTASWPNEAFAECHGQRFFYTQRTLWRDDWKYVFNGFDVGELYNLADDPHELRNLAADPAHREALESMAARMWQIIRETGDHNMANAQYGMFRFAPVGPEGAAN